LRVSGLVETVARAAGTVKRPAVADALFRGAFRDANGIGARD
jgi:hypothetical protein